jgi:hypothetical protein
MGRTDEIHRLVDQVCELFEVDAPFRFEQNVYLHDEDWIELLKSWRHALITNLFGGAGFAFQTVAGLRRTFAWADEYLAEHPEVEQERAGPPVLWPD